MKSTMRCKLVVLTILIGVVSLCVNCTWANERGPSAQSHTGIDVKQTLPAPTFNNNPQLDMILTNYRPILSVGNPVGMIKALYLDI